MKRRRSHKKKVSMPEGSTTAKINNHGLPQVFVDAVTDKNLSLTSMENDDGYDNFLEREQDLDTVPGPKESVPDASVFEPSLSLIPNSVTAALNSIQLSQLRRVREEASNHLETILRSVVKTVNNYQHYEQQSVLVPAKKMIGTDEVEEEEKRMKTEIRRLLKGGAKRNKKDRKVKKSGRKARVEKDETETTIDKQDGDEEGEHGVTHFAQPQVSICQLMFNIIDELYNISDKRNSVLNEVGHWMDKYPPNSIAGADDVATEQEVEEEIQEASALFESWDVQSNVRKLASILGDMGIAIPKIYQTEENKGETRKNLLEEKMNKQRAKVVSTKIYDVESLSEPKNWSMAVRTVQQVLEDTVSSATNNRTKLAMSNGLRQFQFMSTITEKRNEERMKLTTQLDNVSGKLAREKNETKTLRKKKTILETQIENKDDELVELRREMEMKDGMLKEKNNKIYELEALEEERESAEPVVIYQPAPPAVVQQPPAAAEPAPKEKESPAPAPASQPAKPKAPKQQKPRAAAQGAKARKEKEQAAEKKAREKEDAVKSNVIMSLKEAKKELEEIRQSGKARESMIKDLKLKLKTEAERFEQEKGQWQDEIQFHQNQTQSAKKQLEVEQEIWNQVKEEMTQEKEKLSNEVQAKEEIINYQEQRIQEVAREMTLSLMRAGLKSTSTGRENATDKLMESKQMLAKLHLQYEYELEKLRSFVDRESERHRAEMRKMEQDHRRDLTIIYRDTSIILRAVNRFKECLATLLDRENLADAAHGIRNIANLVDDETTTDPHIKLARMAGSVTELMVQMEFKMSQAFMNKRMEIKDTSLEKNFISKDLETREELLKKARELGNLQAEKLKSVREELTTQEVQFLKLKRTEEDKFADITDRNKELSRQNQILNRELTILQKETQEESLRRETQVNDMTKVNRQLQNNLEEQEILIATLRADNMRIANEQKLFLKKSDMMRNIKLLNDAYTSKKITQEKHMLSMALIDKTMSVSGARFVSFVQKYVIHHSWKKICETIATFRKGKKRHPRVEKYLKLVEQNIEKKKKNLEKLKSETLAKRTEMYMHFRNLCNELQKENGIILVRPSLPKEFEHRATDQECMVQKKYKAKSEPAPRPPPNMREKQQYGELGEIKGMKFVAPQINEQTSWQLPTIQTAQSVIVTPQILALDIHTARESASQRVLTSKSCETIMKQGGFEFKHWLQRRKDRDALFHLPSIASLYPEN